MENAPYKLTNHKLGCENQYFSVFMDSMEEGDHTKVEDYLVVQPKTLLVDDVFAVGILPIWDGKAGLLSIYRHPIKQYCWEMPGGFIEAGETVKDAALRELEEEVGLSCKIEELRDLGTMAPAPSILEARAHLFAAPGNLPSGEGRSPELGHGRFEWFSKKDLQKMSATGEILDSSTLIALYRAELLT